MLSSSLSSPSPSQSAYKKIIYKHHKEPWFQLVIRIVSGSFVICFCVLSLIREVHITCVTTTCSHDQCHHADKALVVVLVVLFRLFACHRVCLCVSVCVFVCLCLCICVYVSLYSCLYMCTLWLRDQCHGLDQTRVFSSLGQDSNGKIEGSTSVAFLTIHMKFQYETFYPFTNLKQRKRPCLGENRPKFAAKRKSWRVVTSAIVGFNYGW